MGTATFTSTNEPNNATIIALLNARLADTIDLLYQAKQAHWNVSGSDFYALHELFDKVADELREHIDDIAERVAQIGGHVEGTIRAASERSELPEYPRQISGGVAHVEALSKALLAAATSMREAIDQSAELGDQVTSDIFTSATRAIDKLGWMVQASRPAQEAEQPRQAGTEHKAGATARTQH